MPSIVGEDKLKERFDDGGVGDYTDGLEHMFRAKFLENLNVSCWHACKILTLVSIQICL